MKIASILFVVIIVTFSKQVKSHGQLNYPPSTKQGLEGTIVPGSYEIGGYCEQPNPMNPPNPLNGPCLMFSQPAIEQPNVSVIPGEPTNNDPEFRTHNRFVSSGPNDWTKRMPWRWPGSAHVLGSGCGVAGGGNTFNNNGGWPPTNMTQGYDAALLPDAEDPVVWRPGEIVEGAWGVWANHGGGYSYRLCSKAEEISEECFQRTPLKFAQPNGGTSILQHINGTRVEIPLVKLSNGTFPEGSEWARIPFPGCATGGTPPGHGFEDACTQFNFPEPIPNTHGFGYTNDSSVGCGFHDWSIVDTLIIPEDLDEGEYLISWRWDCEQTTQIWQNCADISVQQTVPADIKEQRQFNK